MTKSEELFHQIVNQVPDAIEGKMFGAFCIKSINGKVVAICPTGWHVPTDAEWSTLGIFLGGNIIAGGKMKATGTEYWTAPNTDATNESGFSGLPGSNRSVGGMFPDRGFNGDWWSSTEKDATTAFPRDLQANVGALNIELNGTPKEYGFSVRCIKD